MNYSDKYIPRPEPPSNETTLPITPLVVRLENLSKELLVLHDSITALYKKLEPITGPVNSVYGNSDGTDKEVPNVVRMVDNVNNTISDATHRLNQLNSSLYI